MAKLGSSQIENLGSRNKCPKYVGSVISGCELRNHTGIGFDDISFFTRRVFRTVQGLLRHKDVSTTRSTPT